MQTFPAYLLFIRTALPAMKRFPAPFAGQASTGISSHFHLEASGLYAVGERLLRQSISCFTTLLGFLRVSVGIDVKKKRATRKYKVFYEVP
mgnify:CR=1 FL=1